MTQALHFDIDCSSCQLRKNSVFGVLNHEEVNSLQVNKACKFFKRGEVIFEEGTRPYGLFILTSGKVKLSKLAPNGREQIVRLPRKGEVIGYRALLSGDAFSASAGALEDTHLCLIRRDVIMDFVRQNPTFSLQIMNLFARDLKNAESRLAHMAQDSVRERLAQALLMLKDTYGIVTDTGKIKIRLRREDIASIIGTAPETTIRFLSEFQKEELLQLKGKYIFLKDTDRLVQVANIWD
jgi:CRP/FNR family transcriptional regulator